MVYVTNRSDVLCTKEHIQGPALYLCPNRKIVDDCQAMGLEVLLLSESMLGGAEAELNDWSYRATIDLVRQIREQSPSEKDIFLEVNFYPIKGVLLQGVKSILTIEFLIRNYSPSAIVWCRSSRSFFTRVLREYLALYHADIPSEELAEPKNDRGAKKFPDIIKGVRLVLASILNVQSRLILTLRSLKTKNILLVSGGLNHLGAVISVLNVKQACKIVFVESEFNFEKYAYCSMRFIPYFVVSTKEKKKVSFMLGRSFLGPARIIFRECDYSSVINKLFDAALSLGILGSPAKYDSLVNFFHFLRPKGVFLDEDYSLERRCLAVLAWRSGVKSFVTSHGIPMLSKAKADLKQRFCESSVVLVNSEFEKKAYENIFFDPKKIEIVGIPRFDEIFFRRKEAGASRRSRVSGSKTVLLCLSSFRDEDFDIFCPWLVGDDSIGWRNRLYIQDLFETIKWRTNVVVRIKTHYADDDRDVREFLNALGSRVNFQIEPHRANIFKLESEADLIVTPESTVVNEAIMFAKPVVVMCYDRFDPWLPWKESGLVDYVHNQEELQRAVHAILDNDHSKKAEFCREKRDLSYFMKYSDAKNTERVAEYILEQIDA